MGAFSASKGHKTKGMLNFDRWGTFSAGGGGGGTRLKGHSISITGTLSARGQKTKGVISISGALFQRTLCNVLNVRKGQIFGSQKNGGAPGSAALVRGCPPGTPMKNLLQTKFDFYVLNENFI